MVFCISILVVNWLGFRIEQVKLNEPALPKNMTNWQILLVVQWIPLIVQWSPGQFPSPPWPLAGWTQVPGTCGFDSWECSWEHCGNLRFMPMKSSWELFLSAVWSQVNKFWFPGTFCNVPRNLFKNSQERFLGIIFMFPGGPIQAGPWMGLVCRKNMSLKSWMNVGFEVLSNGLPLMMVIPENERSGNNPTQKNQKQGNHANALVLLQTHPSQDGNRGRET